MPYKVFFDSPAYYENAFDYYDRGSSPKLVDAVIGMIKSRQDDIKEIILGFYLFNNAYLFEELGKLSKTGTIVKIVTIPPEGYDSTNPKNIIKLESREVIAHGTKSTFAREIFRKVYRGEYPNMKFFFFPHIYVRSEYIKKFSRGALPYSFHIKAFLIKHKDNSEAVGLSSSNFAVRDLVKEEFLVIAENENLISNPVRVLLGDTIRNSIPLEEYRKDFDLFNFQIEVKRNNPSSKYSGVISPIYHDSGFRVEEELIKCLQAAKRRIIFVGQHLCPVSYPVTGRFHSELPNRTIEREGLLPTILEKSRSGIKVKFLSQTIASGDRRIDRKFRNPVNTRSFMQFYNSIKNEKNIEYFVNSFVHSKYIVVDDKVLAASFNFTPTQFIFLDEVHIERFKSNPNLGYRGVYSETGCYFKIEDVKVVKDFTDNFQEIIDRESTFKVI